MAGSEQFSRLTPWIQEWIYQEGWEEFRPIQIEAAKAIFDSDSHLLLCSGTASGKTEAALLPALTLLDASPASSLGILYIGPLKALINDQFKRVENLLKEANIPVYRWHGDVDQRHKNKLMANPRGILQITPESLESILINKKLEICRLFGDLRFIIIDEVHSFMGGDRGRQILAQLERVSREIDRIPRRIGLSATIGDPSYAANWLASGTNIPVIVPDIVEPPRKIRLAVEHFLEPTWIGATTRETLPIFGEALPSHRYIFENTLGKKVIIFSNTREATELVTRGLREIALHRGYPDRYHVHHSCIANLLRESAETFMKDDDEPHVTAATLTLELGMDIGGIERIIQLLAPSSVSSFVQRLGRSGRRLNQPSEMMFVISEDPPSEKVSFTRTLPWYFLQTISIIQLYLEEKWIEPAIQLKFPISLLYHQTMSILASSGELSPASLAHRVLTLSPFKYVNQNAFRDLIQHLISINHIEQLQDGGLIVGLTGEKIVRNFRFYAVFRDYSVEFSIKEEVTLQELGHIDRMLFPGETVLIAGDAWEVTEIHPHQKLLLVKKIERAFYVWPGRRPDTHTKVLQKMRSILLENTLYGYLQDGAKRRITEARTWGSKNHLDTEVVFKLSGKRFALFPWVGTIEYQTLHRILRFIGKDYGISHVRPPPRIDPEPYFITFDSEDINNPSELTELLKNIVKSVNSPKDLIDSNEKFLLERYDHYLSKKMQQKAFTTDYLNIDNLKKVVSTW